jgi:tetratricopeptide (TPR) repeat protein
MIRILEDLGDYERAYAVFQGAFERFPDHPELLKMERTVADQSKRGRMAALQEREAEDRLTTKEHYEKAELHRQFGQAKQAIVHYQRASEEAGLHDLSIAKMAVCLCERRMFELADETLDPIELSKDRAAMHRDLKGLFYRVAQVFEEENYRNQSVKYYKRIFRIDASYRDVVRKLEKLER